NLLRIGDAERLMISYGLMKSIETIKSKPALVADKDILEDATAIGEVFNSIQFNSSQLILIILEFRKNSR
ncbi:hypothetical protein M1146_04730, partial [Patescibacteria group bacterium]|nr:hypothetical protein [Patescibacteria group bacterium]